MEIKKTKLNFKKPLTKRKITTEIILHCSASKEGKNVTVEQIHKMHIDRGFSGIGYNYYIDYYGNIYEGRPEDCVGAHTTNHNSKAIGICYCGGLDKNGKAKDTRTPEQLAAMIWLCRLMHKKYPNATFHGHCEFANKACPCFNVKEWIKTFDLNMPDNGLTAPPLTSSSASDLANSVSNALKKIIKKHQKK